jgi:hypothetical protein
MDRTSIFNYRNYNYMIIWIRYGNMITCRRN